MNREIIKMMLTHEVEKLIKRGHSVEDAMVIAAERVKEAAEKAEQVLEGYKIRVNP